jgi:tetrahydromethanopterin S-methyltransferase subunit E
MPLAPVVVLGIAEGAIANFSSPEDGKFIAKEGWQTTNFEAGVGVEGRGVRTKKEEAVARTAFER